MSISGSATRFSTTTNATSATVAAAMNPSATGEDQPECPPSARNKSMPATVNAIRAAPTQSIRPEAARPGSSAGTALAPNTIAATPSTRMRTKIERYPKRSTMKPPTSASTPPTPPLIDAMTPQQKPKAWPLSRSRRIRNARPNVTLQPPCRIRPSSTTGSDEPTMHNTVPMHNTIMMPSSTRLRPM